MHRAFKFTLLSVALWVGAWIPAGAQVSAIYDQGNNALIRQLERLQTTASVLHTGAHPDDEDSALVAYHARGLNARTAYLSLTRGSGGQNIIGAEQSDALGVIRTEELLQARRLDGAQQFFTRANDFGFSKYRTEASRVWPENELLDDMVRSIRTFRPDVVVSRWNGSANDGHGHHQFAGYLTPLAIEAAADASRFPMQIAEGLRTWQVQRLFVGLRSAPDAADGTTLSINTGEYDPIAGRSFFEIGMQGRSQQKTQQMGSLELRGSQLSLLQLSSSSFDVSEVQQSVFDGIDTTISGLFRFEPSPSSLFSRLVLELESVTQALLGDFDAFDPSALTPDLVRGSELAERARNAAQSPETKRLLEEKITEFETAIVLAAGVKVDALIETETLVPGSAATVAVRLFMADDSPARVLSARVNVPENWTVAASQRQELANEAGNRRQDSAVEEAYFLVQVPNWAGITQPYWLELPREAAAYDWSEAGSEKSLAFAAPILTATAVLEIAGREISVTREVEYRQLDRIRGEVRRRIDALEPAPATSTFSYQVTMPDSLQAGEYQLSGSAAIEGTVYRQAMQEIAYPHISTHRTYAQASTEIEVVDVCVADVNVGYLMGSGDVVPESLRRLGVSVSLLSDSELTTGDLSQFDVIVVGIRASQTRAAYVANNQRLLSYTEKGGTLIVQYQQPDFVEKNLAPFSVTMDRNVRVVDETAPITILEPNHPVFSFPNKITTEDFDGWVQERNNYNFTSFDREQYVPLTEAHDEGEPPSEGAMLYSRIGTGHYVYTAYSWFRQLPNGVPGAYRLFANLLSLSKSPSQ